MPEFSGRNSIAANLFIVFSLIATGCAAPRINVIPNANLRKGQIRTIAIAPTGDMLADAVGLELMQLGLRVIDSGIIKNLLLRAGLAETDISNPDFLSSLSEDGIDAIIITNAVAGYDGRPQNVTVKVVLTINGELAAGATWQNGYGGAQGSAMDRDFRSDFAAAAKQIANALAKPLHLQTKK